MYIWCHVSALQTAPVRSRFLYRLRRDAYPVIAVLLRALNIVEWRLFSTGLSNEDILFFTLSVCIYLYYIEYSDVMIFINCLDVGALSCWCTAVFSYVCIYMYIICILCLYVCMYVVCMFVCVYICMNDGGGNGSVSNCCDIVYTRWIACTIEGLGRDLLWRYIYCT